ncbi:MAG TPA: hypothetical protein VGN20_00775 [Mucilaginibacter sp.]|jgi:hypothetical protein
MNLNYQLAGKTVFALITVALFFNPIAFGQVTKQVYEPKILILSPTNTTVDPELESEFKAQEDSVAKMVIQSKSKKNQDEQGLPENVQLMMKNGNAFLSSLNFFKQASYITQNYLVYRFYERFPNELILLKDTLIKPEITEMQMLAQKEAMAYIISFPSMYLLKENGERQSKIRVQLYEKSSNSYLIDHEYSGDEKNPGFEFTCKDGTLECCINNALSSAIEDILQQIAKNSPTLKKQRALTNERAMKLEKGLYNQPYDASFVKQILPPTDSSINLNTMYQCLYNTDRTQFVAFFTKNGINNSFKSLHDKTDKGKIDIITGKDIHDPGYLESIPKTYAYIVKGVKYNGKWYYQKDQITYFDAPTLEDGKLMYLTKLEGWGYFKENSSEYSPDFWNGNLFEKVVDLKKDPNWEKYKNMWAEGERTNRDYIGLYLIVADKLREEKQKEAKVYKNQLSETTLEPFFKAQVKSGQNHIIKYNKILNNFVLIYPKDRHVILIPVKVTDEKGTATVRFFVMLSGSHHIYEWTYFNPYALNNGYAGESINKMLGSITQWNFAYDTLDDASFWNNYVLLKQVDEYKYLKLLK